MKGRRLSVPSNFAGRTLTCGIDVYGDCLFTTESEIRRHPERAKAFLAASLRETNCLPEEKITQGSVEA